jgi:cytidyltransferase-like protein
MQRKILIMGLPGSGKTTLAAALAPLLNAVVFNADAVRANLSRDLGFSHEDRVEHARRMGWMCDRVVEAGGTVIADFICPTPETRAAFGDAFIIWVDRIEAGRFEDTNRMFAAPERFDLRVTADGAPQYWAEHALTKLRPAFDPQRPTALFIGRYQPFHPGHQRLIEEGLRRVGQVCIAVRDTHGIDIKNPLPLFAVKQRIEAGLSAMPGALWWWRCRTSPTCFTGGTSAIPSSGSFSTRPPRKYRPPRYAGSPRFPASRSAGEGTLIGFLCAFDRPDLEFLSRASHLSLGKHRVMRIS